MSAGLVVSSEGAARPERKMDISLFDYKYPEELVAQHPLAERDASRLMVLDPTRQTSKHQGFKDFADYFGPEDLIVMNDVRVWPSRLYGKTATGRRVEVLLLEQQNDCEWKCLVRPAKKLKNETEIFFGEHLQGNLSGSGDDWSICFNIVGPHEIGEAAISRGLHDLIAEIGLPPLPPYIKRDKPFVDKAEDVARYQTVYAKNSGAAAAPTAGFHFTDGLIATLRKRGVELATVTLHVGRDTFQPVRAECIKNHVMHGESFHISEETTEQIAQAKREGRRVTAIGTTTVRVLESVWDAVGATSRSPLHTGDGHTQKFIYPGYQFQVVDRLLTNFHQPKSTLIMLVSAFAGREFLLSAYHNAIQERYRFFSFGDAMLILNKA